jgi:hypothetical protein
MSSDFKDCRKTISQLSSPVIIEVRLPLMWRSNRNNDEAKALIQKHIDKHPGNYYDISDGRVFLYLTRNHWEELDEDMKRYLDETQHKHFEKW